MNKPKLHLLRKRFAPLLILLVVVLLVGLPGCSPSPTTSKAPEEGKKEELVLAVGMADYGMFDPQKTWGAIGQIRLTHSSLLKATKDLTFVGDLAKSFETSKDGYTWTFKIRNDAKFSNGDPVTIEDVLFTYEMLKEDGIAFDISFVDKMEISGKDTIVFTLQEPRSTFVSQLSEIGIVPKHIYDDNYSKNPIGSGPYQVTQYNDGEQIIMDYNPYWYGEEPQFKKLTFLLLGEDAAFAAAKAGQVDICYIPPKFAGQTLPGMTLHVLESVDSRGISLPVLPSGGTGYINANEVKVGNDITSHLAIRQALNIGLSRQGIIDVTMDGYGKAAYSIVDGTPWFNEKTVIEDGRVEEAKQLLADAGWADTNKDGIVEKDGLKAEFDLYFPSSDQLRGDIALAVADQALGLGIKINIIGATWDEIFIQGKANACLWGGGRLHPHQLYTMYSSQVINTGYNNMPSYINPTSDDYIKKALYASTQEEANQYWKLAQWDGKTGFSPLGDAPIVWLARVDHLYLVNDQVNIGNQLMHSHGYEFGLFGNITEWSINP